MLALHENERVIATYRKTWVVFFFAGITAIVLVVGPMILFSLLPFLSLTRLETLSREGMLFLLSLWWWGVWIGSFFTFVSYYLDVFLVTNERIMHIEQHGAFSRTIAELRLERVQDVTIEQHGVLATLLHFGNVRVQTAGESAEFTFRAIPYPVRVKETVMASHREAVLRERRTTNVKAA